FSVSCDDDMAESDVPEVVMAKFQQMYPNVTATWEKETNGQIKGEFYLDYHEMEVWFKKDGTWVMTVKDLNINELPQAVLDYVSANYKGLQIDDADWVETPTGNYYRVELDREDKNDIILNFTPAGEPMP
ncbi:MAG: PepSY-like domain-containing protein, partial [Bacteroidaceae bacterium]|nr:PepSY-like domain-containing protein [Bacteroidaceae bacterium]